jgi:hypothetical protein
MEQEKRNFLPGATWAGISYVVETAIWSERCSFTVESPFANRELIDNSWHSIRSHAFDEVSVRCHGDRLQPYR